MRSTALVLAQSPVMALRLRRPSLEDLRALREGVVDAELTYGCVGASLDEGLPVDRGLERRRWATVLEGSHAFDAGRQALERWAVHRGAGLLVEDERPLAAGEVVAMAAPLPIGFIEVACRIVAVVDEPDRFGFAYGTLPIHPERGEESFVLTRRAGGTDFTIRAVSAPVHPLARAAPPVADRLQARAVRRYLRAMVAAVAGSR